MAIYQTSKETITNTFKTYLLNRPISTLHVLCSEHSEEEYMTSMKVCILTTDRRPTSQISIALLGMAIRQVVRFTLHNCIVNVNVNFDFCVTLI